MLKVIKILVVAQHDLRTTMARNFERYGPMQQQIVRQPDITGQSLAEQIKRTREMLREMTPAKALEVIEFHRDLNFFEALALAKREGKLIVPNDIHDEILTKTTDKEYIKQNYHVWTGTLVIYEAPDKPFDEQVVYSWEELNQVKPSISFEVPEQFKGLRNCALAIEHPDFELINLGNKNYEIKVSDEEAIHQIEQFPKQDGWYIPDAETGIPRGKAVKESSDARHLGRTTDDSYLSPVARSGDFFSHDARRYVTIYERLSASFDVALVPLAVAPKMSDSHD